jgi:hypothetical protein
MRRTFHRNATEALKENSQFLIKDLCWEDNLLIRQADGFLSSSERERMIDWWVKEEGVLRPQSPGQYEWTAKSKAPEPLQRTTQWVELPGEEVNETFKACVAEFLNEVSEKAVL